MSHHRFFNMTVKARAVNKCPVPFARNSPFGCFARKVPDTYFPLMAKLLTAKQTVHDTRPRHGGWLWATIMILAVGSSHCSLAQDTSAIGITGQPNDLKSVPNTSPHATMSYMQAIPLAADGKAIDIGSHAATRCFDWDGDGDLDLLIGGGDGHIGLYRNQGTNGQAIFGPRESITAGNRHNWGTAFTGVALVDVLGDGLPDLVVAHSDHQISMHQNIGTRTAPQFAEASMTITVEPGCHGRFDAIDWDGDGLTDIITGNFGGQLIWYRNEGVAGKPAFGKGTPFFDIKVAYNSHPRILDFNRDGKLDLLLGVNWGTVTLYLNTGTNAEPQLARPQYLRWTDGRNLDIRSLNGDDTTPELADLNGDGVLDLVSGGRSGRVFLMPGVGLSALVNKFQDLLEKHAPEMGIVLRTDAAVRSQVFGMLGSLQAELASGTASPESREILFKDLAPLAARYPRLLQRQQFDLSTGPHLPFLAAQYWVVLLEVFPGQVEHRQRVADALNFAGGYRQLLIDFGVLFIDNDTASSEQLLAMHTLLHSIPRATWDVETITVADWLRAPERAGVPLQEQRIDPSQYLRSRTGVNIFGMPLGRTENSFANDSPRPGITDVYMICLAHEIAHNMLDTVGKRNRPDLFERKFEGLAQAAGPDVVYRSPKSQGIDVAVTKENFRTSGDWDGQETTWRDAWINYFKGKTRFDRAYSRGNIQFFLDAPQEAFATLANQYFADSQLMLEFCKSRWDAGHRSNVNQFLLIADYLSEGGPAINFYTLRPGGGLQVEPVSLKRNDRGLITVLQSKTSVATFGYDDGVLATDFELVPTSAAK